MSDSLLKISNLNAYYGKSHVLQGIVLHVDLGELVVILGRNGMGKTTLLKSILALPPVSRTGTVIFNNLETVKKVTHQIASLGIGYVPQGRLLFPSLTVDEHLRFSWRKDKHNSQWSPETVYDFFPDLKKRRNVLGTLLSGGEQQMLAIGRALVTNPNLLLMDEPSEGLSISVIQRVEEICRLLIKQGMAILLVEQNLEMAQSLADRAYFFINGRIAHEADGESFRNDPESVNTYLGI